MKSYTDASSTQSESAEASKDDGDYWGVIFNIGWIILASMVLPGVALAVYSAMTGVNMGIDGGVYAAGSGSIAGLAIMLYASVKRAQRKR